MEKVKKIMEMKNNEKYCFFEEIIGCKRYCGLCFEDRKINLKNIRPRNNVELKDVFEK